MPRPGGDGARGGGGWRGAESTFDQVDTYFNVQTGRLKLRQQDSVGDELIFYRRADENSPKLSRYDRIPIVPAHRLGSILAQALGIKTVVRKRRELWRLDNVRIHLDQVEGLGSFVELEVQVTPGRDLAGCHAQADALMDRAGDPASRLAGRLVFGPGRFGGCHRARGVKLNAERAHRPCRGWDVILEVVVPPRTLRFSSGR